MQEMQESSTYFLPCFVSSGRYLTSSDLDGADDEPVFFYDNQTARLACHLVGALHERASLEAPEMAILKFGLNGVINKPEMYEGGPITLQVQEWECDADMGQNLVDVNLLALNTDANRLSWAPADLRIQADLTPPEIRMLLKMYYPGL